MKNFIQIKQKRVRITGIKVYEPIGEKNLKLTFNFSRNRPETEVYAFDFTEERDEMVSILDSIL